MSRRTREGQRLAEDLLRTIDPAVLREFRKDGRGLLDERGPAFDRQLTPSEARKIREADKQIRRERRESGMLHLLRPQWMPWAVAAGVFACAAVTWLLRWIVDGQMASMVAACMVAVVAWVGWMAGRRTAKWRGTIYRAAGAAAVWLMIVPSTGPSWSAVLLWMVGVIVSSSSWWKANRPGHPKAPSRPEPVLKRTAGIPELWDENLGGKGDVLAGSTLTDRDDSKANCESYTIDLRPGKQTITGTIAQLPLIAGGLHTPVRNLVLEPHEDQNPNHVKLTIVKVSPIDKTLEYKGARVVGDQRNMLEVGPYGDGDGWARWRMWQPGEKPMTGSWLSGLIIAGTGIGKSRLMELLAAGYMASGNAVVWFVDPQGGASSPDLQEYADWYVSSDGVGRMIAALEEIAAAREKQNSAKKWTRFDPSPKRPGIVVFLDECHVTIKRYGDKLEALARKTQKVGISFVGLTQGGSLESLGKDTLRASLLANLIVMKTGSNMTKNLLPGLTVDPEALPKIAGFGYTIGTDGSRTAPFRAEYVAEPAVWFARYRMPRLDSLSANAAGDVYRLRREAAVQEAEENRRWVEAMEAGEQPALSQDELAAVWVDGMVKADEPQEGGAFQVAAFPSAPVPRPQDKPARDRVLVAVAQGITRTAEIGERVGLKSSQLHEVLKLLIESEELEQPTRGVYAIAGSASEPVR